MRRSLRSLRWAGLLALVAGCTAGPAGPPEIVVDRTACHRCSMLVSEPAFAAAALPAGATAARVFDDAACLFAWAAEEPGGGEARVWFQDTLGGGWLEAADAVLAVVPGGLTPMGSGVVAFRDGAEARRFAEMRGGEVASLAALRTRFAPGVAR
jgi:copper chaperone NosL